MGMLSSPSNPWDFGYTSNIRFSLTSRKRYQSGSELATKCWGSSCTGCWDQRHRLGRHIGSVHRVFWNSKPWKRQNDGDWQKIYCGVCCCVRTEAVRKRLSPGDAWKLTHSESHDSVDWFRALSRTLKVSRLEAATRSKALASLADESGSLCKQDRAYWKHCWATMHALDAVAGSDALPMAAFVSRYCG